MKKTLGNLIDELTIVNQKIWACEDIKRNESDNDKAIAEATRKTNILNPYRNKLISEIDKLFNEIAGNQSDFVDQGSIKLYGKQ